MSGFYGGDKLYVTPVIGVSKDALAPRSKTEAQADDEERRYFFPAYLFILGLFVGYLYAVYTGAGCESCPPPAPAVVAAPEPEPVPTLIEYAPGQYVYYRNGSGDQVRLGIILMSDDDNVLVKDAFLSGLRLNINRNMIVGHVTDVQASIEQTSVLPTLDR